jgi:hypothetical protein
LVGIYNYATRWLMSNGFKEFFLPGDTVTMRQALPYKPIMVVVKKVTKTVTISGEKSNYFQGIECMWYTTTGELRKETYNTKDLIKVNEF